MEGVLREIMELMLVNFDPIDYLQIFEGDEEGLGELQKLALQSVTERGEFTAVGARHWTRRNRESLEMQQFMSGPMQDPKIRNNISGIKLTEFWERKLNLEDEGLVEEYIGAIEDVRTQAVAQAEAQEMQQGIETDVGVGDATGTGSEIPAAKGQAGGDSQPS